MHELGVLNSMVHTIEKMIQKEQFTKVLSVTIEVGELSGVVPHYITKCWPAAIYKTFMEDTSLDMITIDGIVKCKSCGRVFHAISNDLTCPDCSSQNLEILQGDDIIIQKIECI